MPELPEVETVVRQVRPRLLGRRVRAVDVRWERTLGGLTKREFAARVVGATVVAAWRRAKLMVFDLERDGHAAGWLVGHLRMSGRLQVEPLADDPGPYRRLSLELDDGCALHFVDVRKFGRFTHCDDLEPWIGQYGPEPLGDDLGPEAFWRSLRARRGRLKSLLLDQSFLAGLGNIYVDESLFRARLHPRLAAERVSRAQARDLWHEVRAVLTDAIARQGSSFDAFYRTPTGQPGNYQHEFRVYGRAGQPCRDCGTTIERLVVGQRGTHVCPRCQGRGPRRARPQEPARARMN